MVCWTEREFERKGVTPTDSQQEHVPVTYDVSFPHGSHECGCPFPGCSGSSRSRSGLRNHFGRMHWQDEIHILEEHPMPYPRCGRCGHQIPHDQLNNRHYNTDACRNGIGWKRQREALQQAHDASRVTLRINQEPLDSVSTFVYLGRTIAFNNSDWPALCRNLKRAQQRWGMVARVLEKTGASKKTRGTFYKAVVQSVLLYGSETWVRS